MTTGEMAAWTRRLESILASPEDIRDERLATMMSDLEVAYGIPLLAGERLERFEKEQPFALQLYRAVSEWRDFN